MADLRARVAYLSGLIEGLDVEAGSAEGRVLAEMVGVLGEMAEAVEALSRQAEELEEYVDEVSEDLDDLVSEITFIPDGQVLNEEGDDGDADEEAAGADVTEIRCPNCGATVAVTAGEGTDGAVSVTCPNCGAPVS